MFSKIKKAAQLYTKSCSLECSLEDVIIRFALFVKYIHLLNVLHKYLELLNIECRVLNLRLLVID